MGALTALGVELELAVLLAVQTVGHSVFDAFEVETAAWRKMFKGTLVALPTLGITRSPATGLSY